MNHVLENPYMIPTHKQQTMPLQRQKALQQRNKKLDQKIGEMEKEIKEDGDKTQNKAVPAR